MMRPILVWSRQDVANNSLGWHWPAGCGANAAPYFRIFDPVTHSERYDPEGSGSPWPGCST